MKKYLLLILITLMPLLSMAQKMEEQSLPHIITSKGTVVSPTYKANSNSLEIDIRDNKEETVEIIVTHKGMPIFYDTSIFEEDKVEVDIPEQFTDETAVFVRSGNETHYIGNIKKDE